MFVSLDRTLPVVVLVAGHAGTGKTRFSKQLMARAVALRRPMVFLDKDTLGGLFSKALMQLHTGDPYDRDSEVFQRHVRELEYQALLDVALENAALGVDSILCAPFGRECKTLESYTSFIERTFAGKAIPLLVCAHVEPEEAHRRIVKRQHPMDAYKLAHWDTYVSRRFDILPALLSQRERPWAIGPLSNGDSYGVLQAIHLEESLRWVPASSEMHALPLRAWHG